MHQGHPKIIFPKNKFIIQNLKIDCLKKHKNEKHNNKNNDGVLGLRFAVFQNVVEILTFFSCIYSVATVDGYWLTGSSNWRTWMKIIDILTTLWSLESRALFLILTYCVNKCFFFFFFFLPPWGVEPTGQWFRCLVKCFGRSSSYRLAFMVYGSWNIFLCMCLQHILRVQCDTIFVKMQDGDAWFLLPGIESLNYSTKLLWNESLLKVKS